MSSKSTKEKEKKMQRGGGKGAEGKGGSRGGGSNSRNAIGLRRSLTVNVGGDERGEVGGGLSSSSSCGNITNLRMDANVEVTTRMVEGIVRVVEADGGVGIVRMVGYS